MKLGDMNKLVTIGDVLDVLDELLTAEDAFEISDKIEANLEHWTDDEGLHHAPFTQDLTIDISRLIEDKLRALPDMERTAA